jgi:hypothetical protein
MNPDDETGASVLNIGFRLGYDMADSLEHFSDICGYLL